MNRKFLAVSQSLILSAALLSCSGTGAGSSDDTVSMRQTVSLAGEWSFSLDPEDKGLESSFQTEDFSETVLLPGTTDTNRKGRRNTDTSETTRLSRYYTYEGPAWYSRTVVIPEDWAERHVELFLERTRPSMVWVDGQPAGECGYLSVPHRYDLTGMLSPGKHRITVRIDNGRSIPSQVRSSSHSCSESTQTGWNGIIGRIELQAKPLLHIVSAEVYPDAAGRSVTVEVVLSGAEGIDGRELVLKAEAFNTDRRHSPAPVSCLLKDGRTVYRLEYPLGNRAVLWSDTDPALYLLTAEIPGLDRMEVTFGLRDFRTDGRHFTINGRKTFLRGKHDACVFPLTGYTAMSVDEWRHYFRVCREYGINHCRFHSWCPPEACFEAADLEGIFLQPELPIWGSFKSENEELNGFLLADGENIQKEYSNHASFVMFALGNELSGDMDLIKSFVEHFRALERRHLYAYGSNNYLGTKGHVPGEDFLVTCRVGKDDGYSTHARASFSFADAYEGGYLNNTRPNTEMTFDSAAVKSPVPVIGHETGQYQIYPDYSQIRKYTGVLAPWNLEIFRDRLEKAGMADQAEDFFKASGAWSAELYRADIEMNLRSGEMAGFQLLDLQDYPGQGSAYVGVLDAFMDSKGLVGPAEWREFCCETVPLLLMEQYCWTGGEIFAGAVRIADYGASDLGGRKIFWSLVSEGKTWKKGSFRMPAGKGLLDAGEISFVLPDVETACTAELSLGISGTDYRNSYRIWVYPAGKRLDTGDVIVARSPDASVMEALGQGRKVLLMPRKEDCADFTVGGLFCTDYWNYRMFRNICDNFGKPASPGTLGILTDPEHPIFDGFPTDGHTDWQWYPVIKAGYPMILDSMPSDFRPVVQVIDNVERNHRLALVYELSVGDGKLLVCMSDLETVKDTPEGFQFYSSILDYMNSENFSPDFRMTREEFLSFFRAEIQDREIGELRNISYE